MTNEPVTIIIPTYDNYQQLIECVNSMLFYRKIYPLKIIIINNGRTEIKMDKKLNEWLTIVKPKINLGWEGGLKYGIEHSKSKYIVFANDDIYIPPSSSYWLKDMVSYMDSFPKIGAIGPASNVVAGAQSIFHQPFSFRFITNYLIGFCLMVRREALEKAGGIDETLPGGDDIDLSIRLRKAGYNLVVRKDVFVWHYGFQTGQKLHGGPNKPGGWNSPEMSDNTNMALIKKHGLKVWMETMYGDFFNELYGVKLFDDIAREGEIEKELAKKYIIGKKILDLGCGNNKTIPEAIGVDIIPGGEEIPTIFDKSVADVEADVQNELPFAEASIDTIIARHILEHCTDTINTLKYWIKVLKPGGRLIIAVPNEEFEQTIKINPEHVHVFTPKSLNTILEMLGMKKVKTLSGYNIISFLAIFEKVH